MGGGHRLHRARLVHQQRCKVVSCGGHPGVDHDEPSAVSGDHVAVETPPRNPGDPQSWELLDHNARRTAFGTSPMNVPTPGRRVRPGCGQSALQLVASRYEIGSIMLTSNLPFGKAHLLVGTSDLAGSKWHAFVRYQLRSRRSNVCSPGPSSMSSRAVRPVTVIIRADAGPRTSAPLPQDRSMSVPRREMPHSRPSGTKPNGHRPVRKSSASAASSGSGSNGRLRGILISPPWIKISARGSRGPNSGGLRGDRRTRAAWPRFRLPAAARDAARARRSREPYCRGAERSS